jgi:hypothetical protein
MVQIVTGNLVEVSSAVRIEIFNGVNTFSIIIIIIIHLVLYYKYYNNYFLIISYILQEMAMDGAHYKTYEDLRKIVEDKISDDIKMLSEFQRALTGAKDEGSFFRVIDYYNDELKTKSPTMKKSLKPVLDNLAGSPKKSIKSLLDKLSGGNKKHRKTRRR